MTDNDLDELQPINVITSAPVIKPIRVANPSASPQPACEEKIATNMSNEELISFEEFLKSDAFKDAVKKISNETGVPAISIAEKYARDILGTISDTGITAVTTVEQFIDNVLDVIHGTLKGANHTVSNLTKGAVRTVTLNKKLD